MTRSVVLERHYEDPPHRVFEAWTDVAVVRQWFGCGPDMLWDVHEWDARVGGRLHVSLDFDGTPFRVEGEFLIVDAPALLKYRWGDAETVTVDIAGTDSGTVLTVTHEGLPTEEQVGIVTDGWSNSLGQLQSALQLPPG